MIRRSLAEWRKTIKAGDFHNPYGLLRPGVADTMIFQGGNGNGYRNDSPWLLHKLGDDGVIQRFRVAEMPARQYAPITVNKIRAWVPVPAADAAVPCTAEVRRHMGRAPSTSHPCDAAANGDDGLCGAHRGVAERATAKEEAYRAEQARSRSGRQIAEDAVAALAGFEITGKVYYDFMTKGASGYTGGVVIHAEDLLALLREVTEFREMKEMDL